jgi:ABC-type bacteriocin/lantibiotic exporter with double-glycine peptidase domain
MLERSDIGAIYMFAVLAGLVQLSLPLGIQSIISFVMAGSISTSIIVLIAMVVFGVFINGLLQVRQLQVIEKVKQKLYVRYSLEFTDRLPKLNIEKLDNEYLPEMVNRYFDSVSLQKGLDKLLVDLPGAIIQVLFGLVLLSFYHPVFIAFGLVLIIIVLSIIRFSSKQGLQTALNASSYKYGLAAWLQEIARTIKTFKYTKGTSLHMTRTDLLLGGYLNSRTAHFRILIYQFWSLISFKVVITSAMLIIGSYLLVNQQINMGQFIAADIVIIAIIASIEKLVTNLDAVYDALVSIEKLGTVTEAETEQSGTFELPPKKEGVAIDFRDVHFAYNTHQPVLQGINFSIKAGEVIQLKGPSGAGKSTILRLLTGAFTNYSGQVLVEKLPVTNYSIQSLRSQTGILLGSQDIFQGTLWENLAMGNKTIRLDDVNELVEITGLKPFVESCRNGFDTQLLPVGNKLSNVTRKNILLIRALLGDHRLLLLEEPFEYLDQPFKSKTIDYILKGKKATILIASQDEELGRYCDKTILISKDGVNINGYLSHG